MTLRGKGFALGLVVVLCAGFTPPPKVTPRVVCVQSKTRLYRIENWSHDERYALVNYKNMLAGQMIDFYPYGIALSLKADYEKHLGMNCNKIVPVMWYS